MIILSVYALIVLRGWLDFDSSLPNHWIAECLKKLKKVFDMSKLAPGDRLSRDVI